MVKTLTALVISMTVATGLLSLMDPTNGGVESAAPQDMLAYARSIVVDKTAVNPERWFGISVDAREMPASTGALLSANLDRDNAHFLIDFGGRIHRLSRWVRQSPLADKPGQVRIEIAQSGFGERMTVAQSEALESLIRSLCAEIAGDDGELPVSLDESWARAYKLDAQGTFRVSAIDPP